MNLDSNEIKQFYEDIENVWPLDDKWHQFSRNQIINYINRVKYKKTAYILNAGSGGNDYGLRHRMMHMDIAENKIKHFSDNAIASIEAMPFEENTFTDVICVGSVINYCDASAAIHEISRVLIPGGSLILEFESSWGFEHRRSSSFQQDAAIVWLPYNGELHRQWIYSPCYIKDILVTAGFCINDEYKFHYLSGISFSKHKDENRAVRYVKFDGLCRKFPIIRNHANNIILQCIKL